MSRLGRLLAAALLAGPALGLAGCGPAADAPTPAAPAVVKALKRASEVIGERRGQLTTAEDMIAAGKQREVAAALNAAFDDVPEALDNLAKAAAGSDLEADAKAAAFAGRKVVGLARKPTPVLAELEKGFAELAERLADIEKRTR